MTSYPPTERDLFTAALSITNPTERRRYLVDACGADTAAVDRVLELFHAHETNHSFLASSIIVRPDSGPASELTEVGPYSIVRLIGEGGMGAVYLAEQTQPVRRQVALKIVKAGQDSHRVLVRFEVERQALALMDHPNIARVLDAGYTGVPGERGSRPYFVMELIDGIPLTRYADEHRLDIDHRLVLFEQVCHAIQHAHQKGIIHRDLKPSNVLVTEYDGKPVVKVIDFGVAKAIGARLTEQTLDTVVGTIVGTIDYMSPEQANPGPDDVDTRSDIYSLGVLLYELLTGTTPHRPAAPQQASFAEMMRRILEDDPPTPSARLNTVENLPDLVPTRGADARRLRSTIRGDLDWIVMKCLEKNRDRRYNSAHALARDLERFRAHDPVEAGPPSARYRLQKFVRKNRAAVMTAAGIALTLVAATTFSLIAAHRASVAEVKARDEKLRADDEAAIARAVSEFLQTDLLGQADIAQQTSQAPRDRDVTVRAVLDRASGTITRRFGDRPLTEAAIQLTVGDAYRALGQLAVAYQHISRAFDLRQRHLGEHHQETLNAKTQLGLTALSLGHFDEADQLLRQVLAVRRDQLGPEHWGTYHSMLNLALVLHERDRVAECDELVAKAYDGLLAHYGPDDKHTMTAQARMALVHFRAQRFDQAEALLQDAIRRMKERLGADHPTTITSINNLAMQYAVRDLYQKADPLLREVLALRQSRQGPEHPATLQTMRGLATNCFEQGQFEEGEKLLRETLAIQRRVLTAGHPETLITMNNLGEYLHRRARLDEAEHVLREAAEISIRTLGPLHECSRHLVTNYVIVQQKRDHSDDAEPILRQAVNALPRDISNQPLARAEMLSLLARHLLQRDQFAEAEPLARAARDLRSEHAPGRWTMHYSQVALAAALVGQKKHADAEPLLRESIAELDKMKKPLPSAAQSALNYAVELLVDLLTTTGRVDEANIWRKRLPPPSP